MDGAGNIIDRVLGYPVFKAGVSGKSLKFDENSTVIIRENKNVPELNNGEFTFEAWIAVQAFPWNWVPVLEQRDSASGFFFGVDADGRFGLHVALNRQWYKCNSRSAYEGYETYHTWDSDKKKWDLHNREANPPESFNGKGNPSVPLLKWNHIVGIFNQDKGISIYLNGRMEAELAVTGNFVQAKTPLYIGRSPEKLYPAHTERFYGTQPLNYSFDGLMDEVKIYNYAMSEEEIRNAFSKVKPKSEQPLEFRKIPTGPKGPAKFGAYYTFLNYDENFDRYFRMGEYSDVVVMFDEFPFKLVSWHGINYYPIWYAENDIGIMHEAVETWGRLGCHEALMDKQCRYSNIRIIENNDARVVLHWRHAMNNMEYELIHEDSVSHWNDWCDEILTIYPDGVAARKLLHWCSYLDFQNGAKEIPYEDFIEDVDQNGNLILTDSKREETKTEVDKPPVKKVFKHSYEQENFIVPIGLTPSDILEKEGITQANLDGEQTKLSWEISGRPRGKRIDNPTIVRYNIKAQSKPFMILPSKAARHALEGNGKPWPNCYYWWDHWPVAQIKSDGIQIHVVNGRPSSSCIAGSSFVLDTTLFEYTSQSISVFSLIGMTTEKTAGELTPLARSWEKAPTLELKSHGYENLGYSMYERCYNLSAEKNADKNLIFKINCSEESPIVNLAFVINNWGNNKVKLLIDGKEIQRGKEFRYSLKENLNGSCDLILWIKKESNINTDLEIKKL